MFGEMQAAEPTFPSYTAFEDAAVSLGFNFRREIGATGSHTITAVFKNKTQVPIEGLNMQVAAQKYMVLKIQPPSGSSLAPMAQDLTQEMNIVNNEEGTKPMSLKLKINYQLQGQAPTS